MIVGGHLKLNQLQKRAFLNPSWLLPLYWDQVIYISYYQTQRHVGEESKNSALSALSCSWGKTFKLLLLDGAWGALTFVYKVVQSVNLANKYLVDNQIFVNGFKRNINAT